MTVTAPAIEAGIVGAVGPALAVTLDARWLMAYAAGVGEQDPGYFDTTAAEGPVAHPLMAVAYEWPAALALRARTIPEALGPLGVHASHHLTIHRPPRAGDRLTITAEVLAVRRRRAGALVVTRFEAGDTAGRPVTTTIHGTLYRGVAPTAEAGDLPDALPLEPGPPPWEARLAVPATAGHVYTECARIWNPIHTDLAMARAAGLPAPILHGTATLALAISSVVRRDLDGDPTRVAGVAVRFTGMVVPPTTLIVRGRGALGDRLAFDAVGEDGRPVLSAGILWRRGR
jgi:acyl dehydratase